MSRSNHEAAYTPQEKAEIVNEFSPALAEVLETVAPLWGNEAIIEPSHQEEVSSSALLKIRQLGDKGLTAAMHALRKV